MVVMREASSKKYSKQLRRQASTLKFSVYFPLNPHFSLTYTKKQSKGKSKHKNTGINLKIGRPPAYYFQRQENPHQSCPVVMFLPSCFKYHQRVSFEHFMNIYTVISVMTLLCFQNVGF